MIKGFKPARFADKTIWDDMIGGRGRLAYTVSNVNDSGDIINKNK